MLRSSFSRLALSVETRKFICGVEWVHITGEAAVVLPPSSPPPDAADAKESPSATASATSTSSPRPTTSSSQKKQRPKKNNGRSHSKNNSSSPAVDADAEDDAPSCPVNRPDAIFVDQLRDELNRQGVSRYLAVRSKKTILPVCLFDPSNSAASVLQLRFRATDAFHQLHTEDQAMLARMKREMSETTDSVKHGDGDSSGILKNTKNNKSPWNVVLQRMRFHRRCAKMWLRRTFRNQDEEQRKQQELNRVSTIQSVTRRLTVIVYPQRIVTVTRSSEVFVSEMLARFDHSAAYNPPLHLILDLATACSTTFELAAREELKHLDVLEDVFLHAGGERAPFQKKIAALSFESLLRQLHGISRRAGISSRVLEQQQSALRELLHALSVNDLEDPRCAKSLQSIVSAHHQHEAVKGGAHSLLNLSLQQQQSELERLTRILSLVLSVLAPAGFVVSALGCDLDVICDNFSFPGALSLVLGTVGVTAFALTQRLALSKVRL